MNKFFVKYKPNKAQAVQYAYGEGLEDGLALLVDVVTNAHLFSSNIIKVETNEGTKCPYIKQKRGRTFIISCS